MSGANSSVTNSDVFPSVQEEVGRLAQLPEVRAALGRFRFEEAQIAQWQMDVSRVAAPPFGETLRAEWLAALFREIGLTGVELDDVGNVFGLLPARGGQNNRYVTLSAHIDTVFPATTQLNIRQQGTRLYGPGVSDNGAGIAALLAVASTLATSNIHHSLPFVFIGNVGEEGEGDLRGMRHVFDTPRWRDSIAYSVVVDGAGSDTVVAEALGSRRFEVIARGPGGHSWSDFGAPNPIICLARAIQAFSETPVPTTPKTTFNIGVIRGGTSVNSIPESASMRVDLRSTSMVEIDRMERALRIALDHAMDAENRPAFPRGTRRPHTVQCEFVEIGNRPAGELAPDARLLKVIRAVDAVLGNTAQVQRASTDANIPLSLGREAIAIGGGGTGGGAHTLQEWFDCAGRDLGLSRILLTLLALSGVGE
ncbi:MAG: M20/M25/M40 family metallo-hydrolase [Terriglobales bacterium]